MWMIESFITQKNYFWRIIVIVFIMIGYSDDKKFANKLIASNNVPNIKVFKFIKTKLVIIDIDKDNGWK